MGDHAEAFHDLHGSGCHHHFPSSQGTNHRGEVALFRYGSVAPPSRRGAVGKLAVVIPFVVPISRLCCSREFRLSVHERQRLGTNPCSFDGRSATASDFLAFSARASAAGSFFTARSALRPVMQDAALEQSRSAPANPMAFHVYTAGRKRYQPSWQHHAHFRKLWHGQACLARHLRRCGIADATNHWAARVATKIEMHEIALVSSLPQ